MLPSCECLDADALTSTPCPCRTCRSTSAAYVSGVFMVESLRLSDVTPTYTNSEPYQCPHSQMNSPAEKSTWVLTYGERLRRSHFARSLHATRFTFATRITGAVARFRANAPIVQPVINPCHIALTFTFQPLSLSPTTIFFSSVLPMLLRVFPITGELLIGFADAISTLRGRNAPRTEKSPLSASLPTCRNASCPSLRT